MIYGPTTVNVVSSDEMRPQRAHELDAGWDLRVAAPLEVPSLQMRAVPHDVRLGLPNDVCALLLPRSSLAARGLMVMNSPGLIDPGYTGEVQTLLFNATREPVRVNTGERLSQLLFVRHATVELQMVDDLPDTDRGEEGFGSTGD